MILILFTTTLALCLGAIFLLLVLGQRSPQPGLLMSVLGSGGHTHEMLTMIKSLITKDNIDDHDNQDGIQSDIQQILFIVSEDDRMSEEKLCQTFPEDRLDGTIGYRLERIQRSRQVFQSYFTSIWSTFLAFLDSLRLIHSNRPVLLLCNGPGVCIPVVVATRVLSSKTKIVFIESFCRTRTLSLSGKIIYYLNLATHFMVQWPKLMDKYPKARYLGLLV